MSDDTIRTGGCLCGAVGFETRGAPTNVRVCHCRLCQKAMGSPFFARALFPLDQVSVRGETARYPSSDLLWRVFCPQCGTRLFAERPSAQRMGIAVAAFDDPDALAPECHMFVESKIAWTCLDDGLPQHAGLAP
jgi:hypothetical protein